MHRREFLAALAAAGVAARPAGAVRVAAGRKLERIGVQLYSVRTEMEKSVERTLEQVASIGYREVEFAGYFDRTPEQIREAVTAAGLEAPASHVSWDSLGDGWAQTLDAAARAGHREVVVAWLPEEQRRTLDDYRRWAEAFNRAGEAAHATGLRYAYHNHDFEFASLEGRVPFDLLLAETQPDLVSFELDLFWATKAGADPSAYFRRHPGRFLLVHVKDLDAGGRMVDVGKGRIDFAAIFALGAADIRHHFVEHDQPPDPFASIRASYEHLRTLEF